MEQHRGKMICKVLKDIRMQIAQENDIEFVTSECTHKGDCAGTCPRCEAEVRYLESQLARRRSVGRTVRLTGLSLGLAAMAPALVSCEKTTMGLPAQLDGDVVPPPQENVNLGENLIFDIIPYEVFMDAFVKGGWEETEVYDVYPDGSLGEEIFRNTVGFTPRKYAVKSEELVKEYLGYNSMPERFDYKLIPFYYDDFSNTLTLASPGQTVRFTVASIGEEEMVCYGEVFVPKWAPEAFLGKYVFKRVSDETVAQWDEKYATELKEQ